MGPSRPSNIASSVALNGHTTTATSRFHPRQSRPAPLLTPRAWQLQEGQVVSCQATCLAAVSTPVEATDAKDPRKYALNAKANQKGLFV